MQNILEKAEREGAVRRIRGDEQLGPATLAAPPRPVIESFGSTPFMPSVEAVGAPAATAVPTEPHTRIISGARLDRRLIAASTDSAASEQYRALRTRILHADNGTAVNVLLVTSPGRGEGKTITAGNLALAMAQDYQRRICLLDADLRNPQLQHVFGLPDGPGLSDILSGQATIEDALVTLEDHQLTVLPAGRVPAHPAELLGTTAMRRVLDALRTRFDCVIVDSPATAPLADVGILTPLVDSVVLVVRSSITSKPAIRDAVNALEGSKLLGLVLNDAA
ncbi:MAG TPA: CpsD/CapB family tyrosine-protein kinase [Vicinamibacterales bacterium]|nr:CpsD/CapB family tyrosine-protein kinase [Vicinamibacterales bacterium]